MKKEVFTKYTQKTTSAEALITKMHQDKDKFFAHSLVFITPTSKSGNSTVYNVFANCRQSSVESVIRSFARIYLSIEREIASAKKDMLNKSYSGLIANPLKPCLNAEVIAVTDKNGYILEKSAVSCSKLLGIERVSKLFAFSDKLDLYHNVVKNGATWDNEVVQKQINNYIQSVSLYIGLLDKLAETIVKAAKLNDEDFKKDYDSIKAKYNTAFKMLKSAEDNANKANMNLDAANKAAKDNTDKGKAANLKKAIAAADKAAKEAAANLKKTQEYFEAVEDEYNKANKAA